MAQTKRAARTPAQWAAIRSANKARATGRSPRQWAIIRAKSRASGGAQLSGGAYRAAVAAAGFKEHAQVGVTA